MSARDVDDGVRLVVRVKPKSAREGLDVVDGVVVVRVNAPPVDGAANERVVDVVAAFFAVPRRSISIVRGQTSREKDLLIAGVRAADVDARLTKR